MNLVHLLYDAICAKTPERLHLPASFPSAGHVYAGPGPDFRDYRWGLTTGYAYAGEHFLQLGALYGRDYGNMHLPPIGFGAGSDVGFARDGVTFGPKAFVEYQAFIFAGTRLNIINYIRDGQHDLRILPEAGITLFGYLNLMYGYGLPVVGSELDAVSRHRFSLTINLIRP